jgi:hypothetical protein
MDGAICFITANHGEHLDKSKYEGGCGDGGCKQVPPPIGLTSDKK